MQLFERSTRRVDLTPAGARLLHEARSALHAVDRFTSLADTLRRAADSTDQPLAFGYCHGSEHAALTTARRFHEAHPNVAVRPSAFTSLRIFKDLREGRLNVGLVHPPVPYPERSSRRHLPLFRSIMLPFRRATRWPSIR